MTSPINGNIVLMLNTPKVPSFDEFREICKKLCLCLKDKENVVEASGENQLVIYKKGVFEKIATFMNSGNVSRCEKAGKIFNEWIHNNHENITNLPLAELVSLSYCPLYEFVTL